MTSRRAAHVAALAAVATLSVTSAFSAPVRPAQLPEQVADESVSGRLQPAQVALEFASTASAATAAEQQRTLAVDPTLGLPRWVRATRDVSLWSAPEAAATALADLPVAEAVLRPLGGFLNGRVEVYFPGDGKLRPATRAWVDVAALEPSEIPDWIAASAAPSQVGTEHAPLVSALYVAVIDEASGKLLYAEQPHVAVPQASTTKIATTIVALERASDLNQQVRVSISASAMAARDGSSTMGIEPGRVVALETLLYGMMLPSGNDAAEQVALALADSREQYVGWMNDLAVALGLTETHFTNPSGMDAPGHYSSAYDMAMLARYAMRNPTFRDLAAARVRSDDIYRMHNLNRLLDMYPGADGVKIGYTDAAQKTIVASAVRNGRRVYVSLLHSADLVGDSRALFDWVWDNFDWEGAP